MAWIEPRKDSKFTVRYRDGYGRAAKKRWRVFATETEAREFKRRADAIEMHARKLAENAPRDSEPTWGGAVPWRPYRSRRGQPRDRGGVRVRDVSPQDRRT